METISLPADPFDFFGSRRLRAFPLFWWFLCVWLEGDPSLIHGYKLLEISLRICLNNGKTRLLTCCAKSASHQAQGLLFFLTQRADTLVIWSLFWITAWTRSRKMALQQCTVVLFVNLSRSFHGSCLRPPVWWLYNLSPSIVGLFSNAATLFDVHCT